jgi:hypothetical protein
VQKIFAPLVEGAQYWYYLSKDKTLSPMSLEPMIIPLIPGCKKKS